jgi:AhpD family alkylhydroperoxidase
MEAVLFEGMKHRFGDRVERRVVTTGIASVKYVRPVPREEASGLVAATYEQLARDFQLLAPLTLTSAVPPLLAACWMVLRETLVSGAVPRIEKEVVAEGVSKANECPYCVAAHALMLRGGAEDDVAGAVARGDAESIEDPRLRALATWALQSRSPDHPAMAAPPFRTGAAPEMVGTAIAFHAINRIVDVFLGESPFAMPRGLGWTARLLMKPVASTFARRLISLTPPPGESLRLLPDAPLPPDLRWAEPNPAIAGALARATRAVDELGASLVPGDARAMVVERLATWRGEHAGIGRAWVEDAIRPLGESDRAAARLALLTALASFQIDDGVVELFRQQSPSDEALLATVGWAAFAAARRVGTWLGARSA